MKYKRLSIQELASLEKTFVRFLATQSITGDDWTKIKNNDHDHMNELLDQFSDLITEQTLNNIEYLIFFSDKQLFLFQAEKEFIHLKVVKHDLNIDKNTAIDHFFEQLKNEGKVQTKQTKDYQPDRNTELFKMIESGARIVDGELYQAFQ